MSKARKRYSTLDKLGEYARHYSCRKCKKKYKVVVAGTHDRGCTFYVREDNSSTDICFCNNSKCSMYKILVVVVANELPNSLT